MMTARALVTLALAALLVGCTFSDVKRSLRLSDSRAINTVAEASAKCVRTELSQVTRQLVTAQDYIAAVARCGNGLFGEEYRKLLEQPSPPPTGPPEPEVDEIFLPTSFRAAEGG